MRQFFSVNPISPLPTTIAQKHVFYNFKSKKTKICRLANTLLNIYSYVKIPVFLRHTIQIEAQ